MTTFVFESRIIEKEDLTFLAEDTSDHSFVSSTELL